ATTAGGTAGGKLGLPGGGGPLYLGPSLLQQPPRRAQLFRKSLEGPKSRRSASPATYKNRVRHQYEVGEGTEAERASVAPVAGGCDYRMMSAASNFTPQRTTGSHCSPLAAERGRSAHKSSGRGQPVPT